MDHFIENGSGNIHVISKNKKNAPQILIVPGMFATAEDWLPEFENLQDFSVTAMSSRGQGKSSKNFDNFTFEDHVSDVVAVIDSFPAGGITIISHSLGCLFAIGAIEKRPDRVSGLIMIDYGLTADLPENWIEGVKENPPPHSTYEVAVKIHRDLKKIDVRGIFDTLKIPVLVFKGTIKGHVLLDDQAKKLASHANVQLIRLKHSGHLPEKADHKIFIDTIKDFIDTAGQ